MAEKFVYSAELPRTAVTPTYQKHGCPQQRGPRWSSGFLLCTPYGTLGSAQHGLCINRTWGISKSPRSSHAVRHGPCSRHPATGGCFTFAKLQIILVESPGPRLSSNLTWCREPAELRGQGCRGPATCPQLCDPSGRALASSPDRPGCAAEWAQAVPASHVGQAGALQEEPAQRQVAPCRRPRALSVPQC